MISHHRFTTSKILEAIAGSVLFAIAAAMRLAPSNIRDDSGESYIMVAFLIILGCWAFFDSLFQ